MGHRDESQEATPNSHRDTLNGWELAEVLDQALSQLNSGDDLERILARFPAHAGLLRPLLGVAQLIRRVPPPAPEAGARQAGLNRLLLAVQSRRDVRVAARLDDAVARLRAGQPLEAILFRSPTWANSLRPMLQAAAAVSETPLPAPDPQKKREGRERLLRAATALRQVLRQAQEEPQDVALRPALRPAQAAPQDVARQQSPARYRVRSLQRPTSRPTLEANPDFEEALDEALRWLRVGVDVDIILTRYPAFAARLRPLLEAAERVQRLPPPVPDEEAYFDGREQVVRLAYQRWRQRPAAAAPVVPERRARVPTTPERASRLSDALSGLLGLTPHLRRAAIMAVMLVALILGSFSVTRVAADSLPTSPLYPVKRFAERVQFVLTPSAEGKAKLNLRFSQERYREAEVQARQTGRVDPEVLDEMLQENDEFLSRIKELSPEQRQALLADGAQLFRYQRRVLTELSAADSLLSPSERAILRQYAGEAGDDQATAEQVQRDLDLVELVPSPTPVVLYAETAQPSLTPVPTNTPAPARPTPVPATASAVPATATPAQAEMVLEPAGPEALPTPTTTSPQASEPPGAPAATATSAPVTPPPPVEATPTSQPVPPATPTAAPRPTSEIGLPTLPPP